MVRECSAPCSRPLSAASPPVPGPLLGVFSLQFSPRPLPCSQSPGCPGAKPARREPWHSSNYYFVLAWANICQFNYCADGVLPLLSCDGRLELNLCIKDSPHTRSKWV